MPKVLIEISASFIACIMLSKLNRIMSNMYELASRYKLESSVRSARKTSKITERCVQKIIGILLS